MAQNPYELLGISKTATADEIKKAYRKLARTLHPDVNPDKKAGEKFRAVTAAYELLSDKEKRRRFDAGEIDADGNPTPFGAGAYDRGFGGFGGGNGRYQTHNINPEDLASMFGGGAGGFSFSDLFGNMGGGFGGRSSGAGFGNGFGGRAPQGQDVTYELAIPFNLAITGGETTVGLANGKRLKVKVPAGVTDDAVLRLKGQGESYGGTPGDALIKVKIEPNALYTRDGNNVQMMVPLTLKEAVLGTKITVPTPSGSVVMKVPPYAGGDKVLRLKGKGVTGKGDLLVRFSITLPASNAELTDFMEKWDLNQPNPRSF